MFFIKRMSLAMYAAPFDNYNNNLNQESAINRKKTHNKTQKRMTHPEYSSQKVNAVLQSIHNSSSDESNNLGDFTPPPPPTSMGVENTKMKEGMTNSSSSSYSSTPEPLENDNDNVDLRSLNNNYMNNKAVEEYYKNLMPNYNQSQSQYKPQQSNYNRAYYSSQTTNSSMESENYKTLTDKLNYMINLLEEQQDEKTNNVTEEVVLYSFLGIFIIFVVDSFARVGKYVR